MDAPWKYTGASSPHGAAAEPSLRRSVRCEKPCAARTVLPCSALPSALPPLSSAAGAPAADVRKAAVDALVELYVALGDALVPKLKLHLRDDQVKLVGMFVHKRAATKAAAAAA